MPRLVTLLLFAILSLPAAAERDFKQFETEIDASALSSLQVDCHIGEVRVTPSDDGRIHLLLKVYEKGGWVWNRSGPLEDVDLEIEQSADALRLRINEQDFSEHWTLQVPPDLDMDIDIGIGDVDVDDLRGDVTIDIGIGDARIRAPAEAYGFAETQSGVGDARVESEVGDTVTERTLVTASTRWQGSGPGRLGIEAGIGSATIELR